MKDALTQYGAPVLPADMLDPPDASAFALAPETPGAADPDYVSRRRSIFRLTRARRLAGLEPPLIDYTPEEAALWRSVCGRLADLHDRYACEMYLRGKRDLAITADRPPQMRDLGRQLRAATQTHLVPAEGSLPYRRFYEYIAGRGFPVTQFLRHPSHPEFTPEPDMLHDCLGHVPPFMDRGYADLITRIGQAAARATDGEHVLMLKRFSWFSIEFGLIEEHGETRVFGAGILSSTGEVPNSLFSPSVARRPFETNVVVTTDYDPTAMQGLLFVAPSLPFLRQELEALVRRLGIFPPGGKSS